MTTQTIDVIDDTKKTKKKPKENYFDIREENAVVDFLTASTFQEKNKIYNQFLRKPLDNRINTCYSCVFDFSFKCNLLVHTVVF
jgi:hypothetical protein